VYVFFVVVLNIYAEQSINVIVNSNTILVSLRVYVGHKNLTLSFLNEIMHDTFSPMPKYIRTF